MGTVSLPPLDGSATDQDVLLFLQALLQLQKPKLIVEAGTHLGHFTLVAAHMLRKNGIDGHVYTADIKEKAPVLEFIKHNELERYITYFIGDYLTMLTELELKDIDFAYIDSGPDATPGDRYTHYEMSKPLMAKGGLIICDDAPHFTFGDIVTKDAGVVLSAGRGLSIWER